MANQVASMQTSRNCGLDILSPNVHSGFWPTAYKMLVFNLLVLVFNQILLHRTMLVTLLEVLMCKLAHRFLCHKPNVSNF